MAGREDLLKRLAGADRAAGQGKLTLAFGELVEVVRDLVERIGDGHAFLQDRDDPERCAVCGGSRMNPVHL